METYKQIQIRDQIILIDKELKITRKDMMPYKNRAGIEMLKYIYWLIELNDNQRIYKIGNKIEYQKILKSLNSPEQRFIKIKQDIININAIRLIEEKIGYITIAEINKDVADDKK